MKTHLQVLRLLTVFCFESLEKLLVSDGSFTFLWFRGLWRRLLKLKCLFC